MSAWGHGILTHDLAVEVQDDYRYLLEEGLSGPQATQRLLSQQQHDAAADPQDEVVFWLALAATQSRLGRLEDHVKRTALQLIDRDVDQASSLGPTPRDRKLRRAALERLRARLLGPQPAPVRIRRPWQQHTDLEVGQQVVFRLRSGRRVLLRVVYIYTDRRGSDPVVMLLDWHDSQPIPAGEALDQLGSLHRVAGGAPLLFWLRRKGPRDGVPQRLQVLPQRWTQTPSGGAGTWQPCTWDELDHWAPAPAAQQEPQTTPRR